MDHLTTTRQRVFLAVAELEDPSGADIGTYMGKQYGEEPKPGTLYPALDDLVEEEMITKERTGRDNTYGLSNYGEEQIIGRIRELATCLDYEIELSKRVMIS